MSAQNGIARVEEEKKLRLGQQFKWADVYVGDEVIYSSYTNPCLRVRDTINSAFHARCAPLVEALESLGRELKKLDVVRRYTPYPHNTELREDPLVVARDIVRRALEEYRYPTKGYCKEDDCGGH